MNRLSVVMAQHGLPVSSDPVVVCRVIRCANGLLIALMAGVAAWSLFSRI